MSARVKVSIACLWLSVFAVSAQAGETAQGGGIRFYHTGSVVPEQFFAPNNIIQNYHHYHLDKPIDGYEWVHGVENEYLLVSSTSRILRRIETRPNIPRDPSEAK
jgi:Ni/Co efflux regulator RcnB